MEKYSTDLVCCLNINDVYIEEFISEPDKLHPKLFHSVVVYHLDRMKPLCYILKTNFLERSRACSMKHKMSFLLILLFLLGLLLISPCMTKSFRLDSLVFFLICLWLSSFLTHLIYPNIFITSTLIVYFFCWKALHLYIPFVYLFPRIWPFVEFLLNEMNKL